MFFGVNSLREKLAGVITRRMGDLNPNDIARKSRAAITAPGVRKILKGESDLKVETLVVIAKAIGTSAPELLVEALEENQEDVSNAKMAVEHARLIEMYSDIPGQCQKDVMDLLAVLQRNHSISERRQRHSDRKRVAAESNGPIRVTTPLDQWEGERRWPDKANQPDVPAKKKQA